MKTKSVLICGLLMAMLFVSMSSAIGYAAQPMAEPCMGDIVVVLPNNGYCTRYNCDICWANQVGCSACCNTGAACVNDRYGCGCCIMPW